MAIQTILQVLDVSLTYTNSNGGLDALRSVRFDIQANEFVCILGPSGCGKTSLLRILAGLIPATSGETRYVDGDFPGNSPKFGLVFQKANLMPWRTVAQNIALPLEIQAIQDMDITSRVSDLIHLVGLDGFEESLPRDLSGGMEQRVSLARALAHDPEILLLDEPFGQLDALTREQLSEELLRIWHLRQKTVLMVTHSIDEAVYLADRVIVLSPQPGQVRLDMKIEIPRPRDLQIRYSKEFGLLAEKVRDAIG